MADRERLLDARMASRLEALADEPSFVAALAARQRGRTVSPPSAARVRARLTILDVVAVVRERVAE